MVREDRPVGKDAIQRTPQIQVEVDKWDWNKGRFTDVWYLNSLIQNITWQKTVKTPAGSCQITLLPQAADSHFFTEFNPLDVVKIFEFDVLKFQGYVKKVAFGGWIKEDGNPHRSVIITVSAFGAYLSETVASIDISILEEGSDFYAASFELAKSLEESGEGGLTFTEAISVVVDAWFNFLDSAIGSTKQTKYMETYVDFTTAMSGNAAPGLPKELFLFYGNEESVSLWQVIQKLAEAPFNEFFFDEGPRYVWIDGERVHLPKKKTYLIGRETPFDGSLNNLTGVVENRFRAMPSVMLPLSHLIRFDFNKSMEEVYSVHIVSPATIDLSKLELLAFGQYALDKANFEKYSYRPNQKQLFYMQMAKKDATERIDEAPVVDKRALYAAKTMKNWYEHNDRFTSGVITYMVPSDSSTDPRIGDKIEIEGIDAYFYVEGLSHRWNYPGTLQASASVTRGWKKTGGEVEFKNKIFGKGRRVFERRL